MGAIWRSVSTARRVATLDRHRRFISVGGADADEPLGRRQKRKRAGNSMKRNGAATLADEYPSRKRYQKKGSSRQMFDYDGTATTERCGENARVQSSGRRWQIAKEGERVSESIGRRSGTDRLEETIEGRLMEREERPIAKSADTALGRLRPAKQRRPKSGRGRSRLKKLGTNGYEPLGVCW